MKYKKNSYVIAYKRGDGDYEPLAALHNNGDLFEPVEFDHLVKVIKNELENSLSERLSVLGRELLPDILER